MAKIREGVGEVHVHTDEGTRVLRPGDEVPAGVEVDKHLTSGKDDDSNPLEPVAGQGGQTPLTVERGEAAQKAADKNAKAVAAAAKAEADAQAAREKAEKAQAEAKAKADADAAKGGAA